MINLILKNDQTSAGAARCVTYSIIVTSLATTASGTSKELLSLLSLEFK